MGLLPFQLSHKLAWVFSVYHDLEIVLGGEQNNIKLWYSKAFVNGY